MRLSKKIVSLICLSSMMFYYNSSSENNKEDNSNLSSINVVNKQSYTLVKDQKENLEKTKIEKASHEKDCLEKERILDVKYIRQDITVKSGITKEEMETVLLNYKGASTMAHLSQAFVDSEKEYGVNAFTMAAIVALESGFATSRRAIEDNNLTGYEVYSDDSEGRLFSSQYESVLHTAKHLSKNYLTKGAQYYNGVSVDAVQVSYCPDEGKGKKWEVKVDTLASNFLQLYKNLYIK